MCFVETLYNLYNMVMTLLFFPISAIIFEILERYLKLHKFTNSLVGIYNNGSFSISTSMHWQRCNLFHSCNHPLNDLK
jgi:hypothetical protein